MEKKSDDVTKTILENYKIVKHIHKEPDENVHLPIMSLLAQIDREISHFHISHNAPYLPPKFFFKGTGSRFSACSLIKLLFIQYIIYSIG